MHIFINELLLLFLECNPIYFLRSYFRQSLHLLKRNGVGAKELETSTTVNSFEKYCKGKEINNAIAGRNGIRKKL